MSGSLPRRIDKRVYPILYAANMDLRKGSYPDYQRYMGLIRALNLSAEDYEWTARKLAELLEL